MQTLPRLLLLFTALTTALSAGVFFTWSCSVTPGLARLSDERYLAAFQEMNRAIQNPLFFACFFGAALLLPASTFLHYRPGNMVCFWLLLSATLLYLIFVMGMTILGNVPLNEGLDAFPVAGASPAAMTAKRAAFEAPWNRLNTIRTITSTLAFLLVLLACFARKE